MREIWKPVKGYEGLYEISSYGRVKSLKKRGFQRESIKVILKGTYPCINLQKDNKCRTFKIHRLTAQHFLQPVRGKNEINHKDGNKYNNRVENLEWVTSSENQVHAYAMGFRSSKGEKNGNSRLKTREVQFMRYIMDLYPDIKDQDIADFYKISKSNINNIRNFKKWKNI